MTTASPGAQRVRQPHAVLDLDSRRLKAIKIERLLDLALRKQPMRMLEIGTGSGGIAHYFGTHPDLKIEVDAVDIVDNRLVDDGYRFQAVSGTMLPFPDDSFDVVLTNHVIEHVGDRDAQVAHLREIHRVLRADGLGYLAVPNRWMLVEPHYKLAFLSWWPHSWRSAYLQLCRGLPFYDCEPLTERQAEDLFRQSGFFFENLCIAALRQTLELEHAPTSAMRQIFDLVPDALIAPLVGMIPTLIYRFDKAK
jgi:ubiquinone/menaquinone biosynthesis C-methylase UbiE